MIGVYIHKDYKEAALICKCKYYSAFISTGAALICTILHLVVLGEVVLVVGAVHGLQGDAQGGSKLLLLTGVHTNVLSGQVQDVDDVLLVVHHQFKLDGSS